MQRDVGQQPVMQYWREVLYRRFRLTLRGSAYAFLHRGMAAYRVVREKPLAG